jgi:hypothetical protein
VTPRVKHLPKVDMPEQHAPLPPSSAERWMRCPGSVRAESLIPFRPISPYAVEGTLAHIVFALAILTGLSPGRLTDDAAMAEHLDDMVHAAQALIGDGDRALVEIRLPPLPSIAQGGPPIYWFLMRSNARSTSPISNSAKAY